MNVFQSDIGRYITWQEIQYWQAVWQQYRLSYMEEGWNIQSFGIISQPTEIVYNNYGYI